jgi:glutamate-1-semialdehyde 2,1-aminomutase
MFIGHAHPAVTWRRCWRRCRAAPPSSPTTEHGIRLAEAIVDAVPCAEQVRFVSSGSEADLYAMRLARAFRGARRS